MTFKQIGAALGVAVSFLLITASAAFATSAKSTVALNVRSGPGPSYNVVDTLRSGEQVEIQDCENNGWCYIEHNGPNGWVSSNYLTSTGGSNSGGSGQSGCNFSFNIGSSGPNLGIDCGAGNTSSSSSTSSSPARPTTYSTGSINLQPSFTADLDNGAVSTAGADIWFHVVNPGQKYIEPRNGAQLALGNKSNRGYAGCRAESFSSARISTGNLPVGSYVCAKTNQGRISQFRLNGYAGTSMKLGYTTWK